MFVCFCRAFIFLSFFVRKWIIYINFVRYADANHFTNRCSIVCKWFAHKMKSENATGKQTAFVFVYKLCASMRRTMISCRNRNMGVWEQQNNNTILTRNYQIGMEREKERLTKRALGIQNQSHTAQSILFHFIYLLLCIFVSFVQIASTATARLPLEVNEDERREEKRHYFHRMQWICAQNSENKLYI